MRTPCPACQSEYGHNAGCPTIKPRDVSVILGAIRTQAEDCYSPHAAQERLVRILELVKEAQESVILNQLDMSFKLVQGGKK